MNYDNKTAVITGGAKGIGAACAKLFFEAGANVAVLDVAEDTINIRHARWLFIPCNVADANELAQSFDQIEKQFGTIDFLVNNAGIQRYGTVTDTSVEEWDLVMNVNLKSLFLCSKFALPFMIQQSTGVIINIASVQAFLS